MKTLATLSKHKTLVLIVLLSIPLLSFGKGNFTNTNSTTNLDTNEYQGKVCDNKTGDGLAFATIAIEGTNIATVTNSEGYFTLKVPTQSGIENLNVSYIGYKQKKLAIKDLNAKKNLIELDLQEVSLNEVDVFPTDPHQLINEVLSKKNQNYTQDENLMTAFYRETIQKRKKYASLSEAVVEVYKQAYNSNREDAVRLLKSRKSADYKKLDTVLFKLQGGPYNTLMLDIMKDPYMILSLDMIDMYDFKMESFTKEDEKILYVISFKQKAFVEDPLFYGKLYIDSESLAIVSASYNINTENKQKSSELFIKKKPFRADVYPTKANYLIKYKEKDGKWLYNYSRGEVSFKVDWHKKLFNTTYSTCSEMAVTDWKKTETKTFKASDKIKPNVIMRDTDTGFADTEFWGDYNVIEPEKSIESAIKKIQKQLSDIE